MIQFLLGSQRASLASVMAAAVIAPPLAMPIYAVMALLDYHDDVARGMGDEIFMAYALFGTFFAYVAVALVGVPAWLILRRVSLDRGLLFLVLGGLLPLPFVGERDLHGAGHFLFGGNLGLVAACLPGVLVAWTFWTLAGSNWLGRWLHPHVG